jgi:hypothetical protein
MSKGSISEKEKPTPEKGTKKHEKEDFFIYQIN